MKKGRLALGILGLMLVLAQGAMAQSTACKENARLVWEEVFTNGKLELTDQIYTPTAIHHDPYAPGGLFPQGSGVNQAVVVPYRLAFPDLNIKVTKQYVDGDTVVTQWAATGTHKGPLMGIPASGKSIKSEGIQIDRCQGGKIVESWANWDFYGLLVQIGVIPTPGK